MTPSVSQIASRLEQILGEEADALALETGCVKRRRKLSGAVLASSLILSWLAVPASSLDGLVQDLGRQGVHLSASALCQRFGEPLAHFFERLLQRLVSQSWSRSHGDLSGLLSRFGAVLIEDSSTVLLPQALADWWRGCGGGTRAGQQGMAAIKLFVRWDLCSGQMQGPLLSQGTTSDKRSPFSLDGLLAGSLYIADLGFFSLTRLAVLLKRVKAERCYVLSRLHTQTALFDRQGKRLSLRMLGPKGVGEFMECAVLLGASHRLLMRLIMIRVPEEVAEQRRAHIRRQAQAHGRQPSAETLALAAWTILVTNVPRRLLCVQEALILMRARWQIELLFKLWKQEGQIDTWRSQKPWRLLCEIFAKLCGLVIGHWLIQEGTWQEERRSLFKAAQVVRKEANRIAVALQRGRERLEEELEGIIGQMQAGCRQNVRKKRPGTWQYLLDPSLPLWPPREPPAPQTFWMLGERWAAGKGWASSKQRLKPQRVT